MATRGRRREKETDRRRNILFVLKKVSFLRKRRKERAISDRLMPDSRR